MKDNQIKCIFHIQTSVSKINKLVRKIELFKHHLLIIMQILQPTQICLINKVNQSNIPPKTHVQILQWKVLISSQEHMTNHSKDFLLKWLNKELKDQG